MYRMIIENESKRPPDGSMKWGGNTHLTVEIYSHFFLLIYVMFDERKKG